MDIVPDFQGNAQKEFTFAEALEFIQHKDGRPVYCHEGSFQDALRKSLRAIGDSSLRGEYKKNCKQGVISKSFLEQVFPFLPGAKTKRLVFPTPASQPEDSPAPVEALPKVDLAYTERVVKASKQRELERELERELAEIYLVIDSIDLSTDPFPVDLGEAARWLGYSGKPSDQKRNAKTALMSMSVTKGLDYRLVNVHEPVPQGGYVTSEQIRLTAECFKKLSLRAGTGRAERVREYFIAAEQRFRAAFKGESLQTTTDPRALENVVRGAVMDGLKQQLTEAVGGIGESLGCVESKVSTAVESIESLQRQLQSMQQQLETIKNEYQENPPYNKRRNFSLSVQKRVGRLFYEYTRGGRCLVNRDIQVIDANGDRISPMQFDHWDGNESRNVYDNCVPMSLELHKRKTAGELTADERKRIEGFIDWMQMVEAEDQDTQLGLL